jgi:hypothetical protein
MGRNLHKAVGGRTDVRAGGAVETMALEEAIQLTEVKHKHGGRLQPHPSLPVAGDDPFLSLFFSWIRGDLIGYTPARRGIWFGWRLESRKGGRRADGTGRLYDALSLSAVLPDWT